MPHRTTGVLAATAVLVVSLLGTTTTTTATAATEDGAPSYREFRSSTFVDSDRQYLVNGDEPIPTERGLRAYYDEMTAEPHHDGLVVNRVYGSDDVWSAAQVGDLTYCVSTSFGSDYSRMVSAMTSGAAQWEGASSAIDFVHVTGEDSSCTTRNNDVVFSVEPVSTTQYIARAFFPSSPKRSRNVLVDDSIWTSGSWSASNIVAHELGHVLGFRHEHTRPEAGTCFEDSNWRALTPYDSASIMHYPQCNGSSSDLSMSETDRAGTRAVYGS